MSIINSSKEFIFVHVPKAAGTSVTKVLSKYTTYKDLEIGGTHFGESIQSAYKKRFGLSKHTTASGIRSVIGDDEWDSKFKFSVVRNPYARVVSTYKFLLEWEGTPTYVKTKLLKFKDINEYVLSDIWTDTDGPDYIFRPQTYWLTDAEDRSKLIVDYVGKLENIDADLNFIISKIEGESAAPLLVPQLNMSEGNVELNATSIQKINKVYIRDFKFFGYEMIVLDKE